jgi:hypothetical protein
MVALSNIDGEALKKSLQAYLSFKVQVFIKGYYRHQQLFQKLPDLANLGTTATQGAEGASGSADLELSEEERAIGQLQWMLNRERGVVRLALGHWTLQPGQVSQPWWSDILPKHSHEELLEMEKHTRPASGDEPVHSPLYTLRRKSKIM